MPSTRGFYSGIFDLVSEKRFWMTILGKSDDYPIWMIRTRINRSHNDPKLLVVSGFHGEEVAGPFAVLQWLQTCSLKMLKDYDITFIPLVNPGAFATGKRKNSLGQVPNTGFCHHETEGNVRSVEGQVLADNIDLIKPMAKDGYLSLHEDVDETKFYLYSFGEDPEPNKLALEIKDTLGKHFKACVDGDEVEVDSERHKKILVEKGMVYNFCDGSFDDWMFHLGVPYVIVSETPGKAALARRINAGVAVIDKFIEFFTWGGKYNALHPH
jgi:hypothetical protein